MPFEAFCALPEKSPPIVCEKKTGKVWYKQVRLPDFSAKNILGNYYIYIYAPMSAR